MRPRFVFHFVAVDLNKRVVSLALIERARVPPRHRAPTDQSGTDTGCLKINMRVTYHLLLDQLMLFDVFVSIPLRIFSVVYQLKISFLFLERGILISVHWMSPMSSYAIKASSNQKMIKSSPELASSFCENEMWIWSRSGSCVIQRCNVPVSTPLFGLTVL